MENTKHFPVTVVDQSILLSFLFLSLSLSQIPLSFISLLSSYVDDSCLSTSPGALPFPSDKWIMHGYERTLGKKCATSTIYHFYSHLEALTDS